MIRVLLRAAETAASGRRPLRSACVPGRACPGAEPGARWRPPGPRRTAPPKAVLTVAPKNIWSQAHGPRNAKDDGGKPLPVLRSERLEPAASPSQKGSLLYTIFKELFSSSSPNKIYGKALEKCRIHPEVISIFGKPLKGYGEMSRRGRRQHVSFIEYVKDGLKHMRLKFYIEGSEPGKQGTVHVEVKENPENGKYEFRYIFVETESFPRRTIVIEDNRSQDS